MSDYNQGVLCRTFGLMCDGVDPRDADMVVVLDERHAETGEPLVYMSKGDEGNFAALSQEKLDAVIASGDATVINMASLTQAGVSKFQDQAAMHAGHGYLSLYHQAKSSAEMNNMQMPEIQDLGNLENITADKLTVIKQGLMDIGNIFGYEYAKNQPLDAWAGNEYEDSERQGALNSLRAQIEEVEDLLERVSIAEALPEFREGLLNEAEETIENDDNGNGLSKEQAERLDEELNRDATQTQQHNLIPV